MVAVSTVPPGGTPYVTSTTGTWTPTYGGSTGDPTCGYANQYGYFTKTANEVRAFFELQTSSVSGGSGLLLIRGLPYPIKAGTRYTAVVGIGFAGNFATAGPKGGYGAGGDSHVILTKDASGIDRDALSVTNLTAGAGNSVIGCITYLAA